MKKGGSRRWNNKQRRTHTLLEAAPPAPPLARSTRQGGGPSTDPGSPRGPPKVYAYGAFSSSKAPLAPARPSRELPPGRGPRKSRPFPQDRLFFILNRFLTAPGPGEGPRRPKTPKNRPLQFFCVARICGVDERSATATARPSVGPGRLRDDGAPPVVVQDRAEAAGLEGGRLPARGPSEHGPGRETGPGEVVGTSGDP